MWGKRVDIGEGGGCKKKKRKARESKKKTRKIEEKKVDIYEKKGRTEIVCRYICEKSTQQQRQKTEE